MADTGFRSPSAFENNVGVVNPANAYSSNDSRAIFTVDTNDRVDLYNFGFSIPAGSTIDGIEISVEARMGSVGDPPRQATLTPRYNSRGTNAPSSANTSDFSGSDTTLTVGGATSTFGRTWADTDFSNANFSVRIQEDCNFFFNIDLEVDHVQVKVYYTEPSWGGTINGVTNPSGMLGGGGTPHISATDIEKISSHEV